MGKKTKAKTHVRDGIMDFIHRLEDFLQKPGPIDGNQIKIRLEKLEEKWKEFEEIQCEIEFSEEQEENMELHSQVTTEFEEKYFEALIDSSPDLSGIQKFHYLRASLKGDALKLVDSYPMSESNYRVAWSGLVSRFLKKRHMNSLLEYPKMKRECAVGIHDSIDSFERNTKILDQLGEQTKGGWGAMLTHLMVSKLDDYTQKHWEEHATHHDNPCYSLLIEFLKNRTRVLDAVSVDQHASGTTASTTLNKLRPVKVSVNSATGIRVPNCAVCNEKHYLTQCPSFSKLDVDKRLRITNSKRLCSNCLGRSHMARGCPSKYRCKTCSKKHHTLLHPGFPASGSGSSPAPSNSNAHYPVPSTFGGTTNSGGLGSNSVESSSINVAMRSSASHVLLLTVLLKVQDNFGKMQLARALLDCGSQANLMSENLCQLLRLPRRDKNVEISGIGQSKRQSVCEVSTTISSRVQEYTLPLNFLVLDRITDDQPSISLPLKYWNLPASMKLADPNFMRSGPIDMILGSQFFYEFHLLDGGRRQMKKLNHSLPSFVKTVFGWVAAGEIQWNEMERIGCNVALTDPLEKAIEKFWKIEEFQSKIPRSQEEEDCELHFLNTIARDENGRFVAQYPKTANFHEMIGDSKGTALRRFHQLEKRLEKDVTLGSKYNEFLEEYLESGHMKLIGEAEENLDKHKPHHPVFKESSTTTKLRVVFDGSAKTTTNRSLNDALLTGPVIQDDLFELMVRFRKNAVALVADIEKMYRLLAIILSDIQPVCPLYSLWTSQLLALRKSLLCNRRPVAADDPIVSNFAARFCRNYEFSNRNQHVTVKIYISVDEQ
ncbi:uncharacterized protein LOC129761209 [Toxorhynchites rutilus septentrionalis]|uniref:uncharacterized protein LOC129761209 n=1 Tax=Toxorhynchites rutilus septentrionalis TaxID=329112 RepID=UPI0024786450|nr:uncharacterized protein LOC129761209 [Toxorhynchites rutilus septentrionalis]